jgi:hypothetical protein
MGQPMPNPKNPDKRQGGNATSAIDDPRFIEVARGTSRRHEIERPQPSAEWRPQARSWYNSLALSGQSDFYEASDWATAVAAAQAYDIFLRTYNAAIFASFVRLSERLGVTVTDRKRSRIELTDPEVSDADEDAADKAVIDWRDRLGVVRNP